MRKLSARALLGMMVVFGLATAGLAQIRASSNPTRSARLKRTLPTIYIDREILSTTKNRFVIGDDYVWLRLYNNSRWGIRLETSGGLSEELGDSRLYYEILSKRDAVKESIDCHVCSVNILRPGKNILFGVPRERLADAHALRINFSYEFEDELDVVGGQEPTHYVFFYTKKLATK